MRNAVKDGPEECSFLHSYYDTALDAESIRNSCGWEDDFYVNPPVGLFPAPWPEEHLPPGTELRFYVLGIAVGKCLAVRWNFKHTVLGNLFNVILIVDTMSKQQVFGLHSNNYRTNK